MIDDRMVALLAALDEALAAGVNPSVSWSAEVGPEQRRQLDRGLGAMRRLRRTLRRPRAAAALADPEPESAGDPPFRRLGRFHIRRELGRGAHGIVFLAHDPRLGRDVALKVPRPEAVVSPELRERFLREARAVAGLDHPGVVPVYEAGEVGPICYIASAYCPGVTLRELLKGQAELMSWRAAAALVADLADAVQHAHARGILHRDLKPCNVLLPRAPSATAGSLSPGPGPRTTDYGLPRITDFGLAKFLTDAGTDATQTGTVLGTPAYMAPEQAAGKSGAVGPEADVYALGALLYEVLTGRPPFQAESLLDTLDQVRTQEPVPPARLRPGLPRDLETVCLKCLEKEPRHRYPSAGELAEDLRRVLTDRPVHARRSSLWERGWRWCRRNPAVAALAAAVAGLVLVLAGGSVAAFIRLRDQLAEVEHAHQEKTDELWNAHLAHAQASRWSDQVGRRFEGLDALARAAAIRPDPRLRNEAAALLAVPDMRVARELPEGWPPGATAIAFDSTMGRYARGGEAGTVTVRRLADDAEVAHLPGPGPAAGPLVFSPDGHSLAVRYRDDGLWVWDLGRCRVVARTALRGGLDVAAGPHAYSPDGRRFAVHDAEGRVRLLDVASGAEVKRWSCGPGPRCVAFHPDGAAVAVGGPEPPYLEIREVATGAVVRPTFRPCTGLCWSADGGLLAEVTREELVVWSTRTWVRRAVLTPPAGHHTDALAFSPRGDLLVTKGWDDTLRVWDPVAGRQLFSRHGPAVAQVSADGRLLAATRDGSRVRLWELTDNRECVTFAYPQPTDRGMNVSFSPDGRLLACAGRHGVQLCDAGTGRELAAFPVGLSGGVAFAPDGAGLFTTGAAGLLRWPIRTATEDRLVIGPPEQLLALPADGLYDGVALCPAGKLALSLPGERQAVEVLDVSDPRRRIELPARAGVSDCIAISPDGRWVAAGTQGVVPNTLRVWDVGSGKLAWSVPGQTRPAFSPDGKWLAAGREEARVWEVGTWRLARTFPREEGLGDAWHTLFSPDGRVVAIAYSSNVLRLAEARTGRELVTLAHPNSRPMAPLCFSPDGTRLAAVTANIGVRVWDLRLIRERLAQLGLDWDLPPYQPARAEPTRPLRAEVVPPSGHR